MLLLGFIFIYSYFRWYHTQFSLLMFIKTGSNKFLIVVLIKLWYLFTLKLNSKGITMEFINFVNGYLNKFRH